MMTHHPACACWRCCAERDRLGAPIEMRDFCENEKAVPVVQWSDDDGSAAHEPEADGLRPPSEHKDKEYHWIQRRSEKPEPYFFFAGRWMVHGSSETESAKDMAAQGWRYLGPAEFVTVLRNEDNEKRERLANQAEQIGALMCRVEQLEREKVKLQSDKSDWIGLWSNEREFWRVFYAKSHGVKVAQEDPRSPSRATGVAPAFPANALKHSR